MKGFRVFKRTKSQVLKDSAASATDYATALAKDQKFRKELLSAMRHGTIARRRAASRLGFLAAVTRLATDVKLKTELLKMTKNIERAVTRAEKKAVPQAPQHDLRPVGAGAVAAVPQDAARHARLPSVPSMNGTSPRTIDESIEVNVPVSVAYNQWTQFEDFPLFMEGVDHVQQLDDTRLHWVATVAGKKTEWDAKILEQHPDRQISWISEDGKKTRGTVTFEPLSEGKTQIRLSMSYQADPLEAVGSAAGLDSLRVHADLERFKELVESRGTESGAWRGEVAAAKTKS